MNEPCFYRVSVKGIVVDETGRFLLSREENNMWDMLGGGIDHGEDPTTCLRREVHEETGLVVTYISPAPKYFITAERHSHSSFIANVIYEIKLESLEFTASEECQELRFVNVEEARQLDLFPTVRNFIGVFDPNLHV